MERPVSRRWILDRRGETFTDHTEGSDLCADRRDRSRPHDLAPRALGRSAELGLPLLLAAGCHVHALGADASRLLRRGAGVARLASEGDRRQPAANPDHVRSGRRAMVAGIDCALAAWLREIFACADWQRSVRAITTRRLRRDCRCYVPGTEGGHPAIGAWSGVAAAYSGISGDGLAGPG